PSVRRGGRQRAGDSVRGGAHRGVPHCRHAGGAGAGARTRVGGLGPLGNRSPCPGAGRLSDDAGSRGAAVKHHSGGFQRALLTALGAVLLLFLALPLAALVLGSSPSALGAGLREPAVRSALSLSLW